MTHLILPDWHHCVVCRGLHPQGELKNGVCGACRIVFDKRQQDARKPAHGLDGGGESLLSFAALAVQRRDILLHDLRMHLRRRLVRGGHMLGWETHESDALLERIDEMIGPEAPSSKGEIG